MLRDVSDVGHSGTGRFELNLISISDLDYAMRFEIELLTERLIKATSWIRKQPHLKGLKLGYF